MKKAWFLITVGLTLVGLGSTGLALFHLEVQRQQEESRATAAEEARKVEEQRAFAEELKSQLEDAKIIALETRLKLLSEEKKRDEETAKHKRDIEALAVKISRQGSRGDRHESSSPARPADENRKGTQPSKEPLRSQDLSKETLRSDDGVGAMARTRSRKSLTLRMNLDPVRSPQLRVAHVHVGDKVRIRVKRPARGTNGIYVGLSPLGFLAEASQRGSLSAWAGPPSPVILHVVDGDRFKISPPTNLDPDLVSTLSTRDGAILTIGTGSRNREAMGFYGRPMRGGIYEIEVTIETDNRWDIPPRSLI